MAAFSHAFTNPVAFTIGQFELREKIAAFDYDDTLVSSSSAAPDKKWVFESVPARLRELHSSGFCILVFTNQQRLVKLPMIHETLSGLGVPMLVSIGFNFEHKKPRRLMFDLAVGSREFDRTASFYCGDCMGRAGDRNDVDAQFAKNTGLIPVTPEQLFAS